MKDNKAKRVTARGHVPEDKTTPTVQPAADEPFDGNGEYRQEAMEAPAEKRK